MSKNKKVFAALAIAAAVSLGSGLLVYCQQNQPASTIVKEQVQQQPVQSQLNVAQTSTSPQTQSPVTKPKNDQIAPAPAKPAATAENVSDQKIGWYYKPNNQHKLPEVNPTGKALLEKYDGLYHGNLAGKNIYLTFDEGYENGYTAKILDALKEANVKAAFFITGDYIKRNPELVQRMVNEGHIVGNHTDHHPSLPEVSNERIKKELSTLSQEFEQLTGKKMKYLRPPKGEYSERTLKVTRELGYRNVFWSVALVDWQPDAGSPEQNKATVMQRLHNGAIVLLHAVNKANAEMLPDLIKECKQQGYQFKSLDEIN
ncbi:delta-lactam-biosynthetic de-N-acetylase [Desulfotomaculum nigrificans CO-1-SRB]|uniref:Delta-lactam-biosynthetic de-N-acetylase n=1 Tax=Desulfotomaculum nigrificans (strain DSM 14880 / VKM B-2319 / CO-1-SRB) TaxID=868595 RepID=F6B634_DESCC|nr:delta-lactam-biosynthetic de-N-acetylase [Desulfotomaculum nigrificans]AEF94353.1 delta-lactam-biosynthetic de-N-acetylase [Desulfotomaculum nigrificans CO-1-SRB]